MKRPVAILLGVVIVAVAALLPLWLGPFYTRVAQFFFFSAALAIAETLVATGSSVTAQSTAESPPPTITTRRSRNVSTRFAK